MKKDLELLWTDFHSNIHHEGIKDLPKWFEQVQKLLDFWPIAYYPFYMKELPSGMGVEDHHDLDVVREDWEYIRKFTNEVNAKGWPMFMGYEWQGSGLDGDHNVFFKDNNNPIEFPLRYEELVETYKNTDAIGIPHHLAYQLNNRGKNWATHNEAFSPFAEIYSSHGSSENDYGRIPMNRHIHMGPRVGKNSVEDGLEQGYHFGIIASGDNHQVPAMSAFGTCALWSEGRSKDQIWDALMKRHVYGVSDERIALKFNIDDAMMGDVTTFKKDSKIIIDVKGANALDYIEVLAGPGRERIKLIDCARTPVIPESGKVKFQFKVEFGWGPDRRVFPDIASKQWNVELKGDGKILRILPCWNNFGQNIIESDENHSKWELTTYKTTQTGKWMGASSVTTESMVVEMEADINGEVELEVDGKNYKFKVRDILQDSTLISLDEEIKKLIKDTWGEESYYRNDTWWHNSYKFKVHRGALLEEYEQKYEFNMDLTKYKYVRVRVNQKNGNLAWSSPIFSEE